MRVRPSKRAALVAAFAALAIGVSSSGRSLADLSRDAWRAKPAETALMRPQGRVTGVVIHYTAAKSNPRRPLASKLRNLQHFAMSVKGWGDLPYHFYIGVNGGVAEGRSLDFAGDSNTRYDTTGLIQIVVEGDFEKEEPKPAQLAALARLLFDLRTRYKIQPENIGAHKDHAPTLCPGKHLYKHILRLRGAKLGGAKLE